MVNPGSANRLTACCALQLAFADKDVTVTWDRAAGERARILDAVSATVSVTPAPFENPGRLASAFAMAALTVALPASCAWLPAV